MSVATKIALLTAALTAISLVAAVVGVYYTRRGTLASERAAQLSDVGSGVLSVKATTEHFAPELSATVQALAKGAQSYFEAGQVDFEDRRYREAIESYRKSLQALPTMSAALNLSEALILVRDYTGAGEVVQFGLQLTEAVRGDTFFRGGFQAAQGHLLRNQGDYEGALVAYRSSLALARKGGHQALEAAALSNLALVAADTEAYEEAERSLEAALAIVSQQNNTSGRAVVLANMAVVQIKRGRYSEARATYAEALSFIRASRSQASEADAHINLASIDIEEGALESALSHAAEATRLYQVLGNELGEAFALLQTATVHMRKGDYRVAQAELESALETSRRLKHRPTEARLLEQLAYLSVLRGLPEPALRFADAAALVNNALRLHRAEGRIVFAAALIAAMTCNKQVAMARMDSALVLYERAAAPLAVRATVLENRRQLIAEDCDNRKPDAVVSWRQRVLAQAGLVKVAVEP